MASTPPASYFTQTTYEAGGVLAMQVVRNKWRAEAEAEPLALHLTPAGAGWEHILDAGVHEQIPRLVDDAIASWGIPARQLDVGRYDVICDAPTAAWLLDQTIGLGTQLDRALGYEANASGTSYLGPDPLALLGAFQVGAPSITVTANRSAPAGLATVKWDDEGAEPMETTLVQHGTLVDYQTTRSTAEYLRPWYTSRNMPVRSNGCAGAPDALAFTMQHTPNLSLHPALANTTLDDLIADTKKGLVVTQGTARTEFQARSGTFTGAVREITNGKLGAVLTHAGFLFNSVELWKNVLAIGGTASQQSVAITHTKGQPEQRMSHSVSAVPIKIRNVAAIDLARKA